MQKNSWFYLGGLFVFSALGTFLRWLQNLNCFEADTGLFVGMNLLTVLLLLLCAAFVIFLLLTRAGVAAKLGDTPRVLCRSTVLVMAAAILSALLFLVGGISLLTGAEAARQPQMTRILGLLAMVTAVTVPALLLESGRDQGSTLSCLCSAMPLVLYFFWLILEYKEQSTNPVLWSYGAEIVTISICILAFYHLAGYYFGKPRPGRVLLFSGLAVYACIFCLTDDLAFGKLAILLGTAFMHGTISWAMVSHAVDKADGAPQRHENI